jgi:hypothetical protein
MKHLKDNLKSIFDLYFIYFLVGVFSGAIFYQVSLVTGTFIIAGAIAILDTVRQGKNK